MEAAPSPVGVATASPLPPQWPAEPRWIEPPNDLSVRLSPESAPVWSRPAQGAAVLLLLLALALLTWHAWNAQRGRCQPARLEAGALPSPSLDLNHADHAQFAQLPGVGENLARRIQAYRIEHNGFRTVDDLRLVKGIGPKLLEKVRPHVYVEEPALDEEDKPTAQSALPVPPKVVQEKKPVVPSKKEPLTERIDVNRATAVELQRLPGIGRTLSQRIIEARTQKPFRTVDDLRRVRGIGMKTLERLRPHVLTDNTDKRP